MLSFFDTHAHYNDEDFDIDRNELLESLPGCGISLVLNPGCDFESSKAAVGFADKYDYIYAAVGWHPHEAKNFTAESAAFIREKAAHPKVMAIGEIGLDYHYNHSDPKVQMEAFVTQMDLARECSLPVIIHDREAHGDCMDVISRYPDVLGVFHCYSGSAEMAKRLVELGWYLSFTGAITFKNARRSLEAIEVIPNDRIMIETDAPYLAPVPYRGKRNDSRHLAYTAQVIADVKGLTTEEVASMTFENGKRFFNIDA